MAAVAVAVAAAVAEAEAAERQNEKIERDSKMEEFKSHAAADAEP